MAQDEKERNANSGSYEKKDLESLTLTLHSEAKRNIKEYLVNSQSIDLVEMEGIKMNSKNNKMKNMALNVMENYGYRRLKGTRQIEECISSLNDTCHF